MTACILAFDTSTEQLAVGLNTAADRWLHHGAGGAQASAALLPQVHALLARAGLPLAAVEAIAFGRGPGAFTGLRTSCAVAQGLALGLGCPVLPIDSLLIVAEDARTQAGADAAVFDVGVAMDARMDEIYTARWRWAGGRWQVVTPAALCTLPALCAAWAAAPPAWLAGSALVAFGPRLVLPVGLRQVPQVTDRAGALLRLAVQAHAAGEGLDAAQALPLYLRDKVAFTTDERETARAAAAAAAATA